MDRQHRSPPSTQARRLGRLWLEDAARRYETLRLAAGTPEALREARGLLRSQHRPRSVLALKRQLGPYARGFVTADHGRTLFVMSFRPTEEPLHAAPVEGRDEQTAVLVWSFGFGRHPDRKVVASSSLWGLPTG